MKRLTGLAAALALVCAAASAQPGPDKKIETVIVTALKIHAGITPNAIAHDFVRSFATPDILRVGIARWQTAICPDFEGLAPQFAQVMESRFRDIARQVSVAMKEKGCRPNLFVIFTTTPQAMLDALRKKSLDTLGYHAVAAVAHPIQAWYETGITDLHGKTWRDQESWGITYGSNYTSFNGPQTQVWGWRFRQDATADLLIATIIVDSTQAGKYMVGSVADYVAVLALSQTEDYDDCQLMPSITNLLTPNCDDKLKPDAITPADIAYLHGVYKMDAGATLQIRQDQIAAEMEKAIPVKSVSPAGPP
jgi:hypothetical protein